MIFRITGGANLDFWVDLQVMLPHLKTNIERGGVIQVDLQILVVSDDVDAADAVD